MCLMLYLATASEQPCFDTPALCVREVEPPRDAVRGWLTPPVVRLIGAHTGCSCGFRHVMADEPVEYDPDTFDALDADDRASADALIDLVRRYVEADGTVEMLPVWDGDEGLPPLGTVETTVAALEPETWVFTDRFRYRVTRGEQAGRQMFAS